MSAVWSDSPTGVPNRSPIATIARRLTCSGGHGYAEVHCITSTSLPASWNSRDRALDVLDPRHPGGDQDRLAGGARSRSSSGGFVTSPDATL